MNLMELGRNKPQQLKGAYRTHCYDLNDDSTTMIIEIESIEQQHSLQNIHFTKQTVLIGNSCEKGKPQVLNVIPKYNQ